MLKIIKNILWDFWFLYQNFFHWNLSKILINIFSILLWILLALPFFIILWLFIYFDPIAWKDIIYSYINWSIWLSFISAISSSLFYVLIEAFLFITWVLIFLFWASYKMILFTKLNIEYKNRNKLNYMSNLYFDKNTIIKYLGIVSWIWIILLIPFLVFLILFTIYIFSFWWIESIYTMTLSNNINIFSILSLSTFLILLFVFIYLSYKVSFSYIIMLDEDNLGERKKALYYVKKSFKITNWFIKFIKFLLLIIIFTIFISIIDIVWKEISNYWDIVKILYTVFIFLCINWLFEMLLVWAYYNIMIESSFESQNLENYRNLENSIDKEIV